MARPRTLPVALLLAATALAWCSASNLFVGAGSAAPQWRTAMHAEQIIAATPGKSDKMQAATGAFEYSTGARNEVSIITPQVDSEGIKGYLSLNIIFFGIMMIMTAGGMIELQRFFPDSTFGDEV
eukprot:CAMPEP_0171091082 /NCGR_PEP_ID=MMETSP0766_2-20121228/32228_1 /TAXON_ID=439317 /ORGANISM="Gambierdiscus australes, Strain CAWD 149" /LENGTH=124 /DNA_ID=CAMNT_0011549143 /DNA_START=58 /DNA_END=433 /DNA_ORIENTATION=+